MLPHPNAADYCLVLGGKEKGKKLKEWRFTDDSPFAFSSTAFAVEGGEEVVGSLSASHVSMFDAMSGAQYEDGRQYGPQH
ncbi:hypothetical protein NPIL_341691 [Nephila pilipes]|uniref:Uncharacterized protein n=1 Tax=Nephila pilipes TaxID=299642 RepID=A0A8X6QGI9_NEPPI|nr:hypothetical protein NPIL_341691 [Nephila pilipes]